MNFGQAIEALKEGKMLVRKGWNGKNMFIFMRPYDNIDISKLSNIKSLPENVKKWFVDEWAQGNTTYESGNPIQIHFNEYLCMVDPLGNIVNGWLASQTDMLSDDWEIKE